MLFLMENDYSDNRLVSFWREIETTIYTIRTGSTSSCSTEATIPVFIVYLIPVVKITIQFTF